MQTWLHHENRKHRKQSDRALETAKLLQYQTKAVKVIENSNSRCGNKRTRTLIE